MLSDPGSSMTILDLTFWLLVILLGGIVWTIESGVAARYRSIIMSSAVSTLGTMLVLMFWAQDSTKFVPLEKQKFEKKKGGDEGERGEVSFGDGSGGKKRASSSGGGGNQNQSGEGSTSGGGGGGGGGAPRGENGGGGGAGGRPVGNSGAGGSGGAGANGDAATDNSESGTSTNSENEEKVYYSREPFKDCPVCPSMVIVPAGTTSVGAGPDEGARGPEEQAAVPLPFPKPFAVSRLEITRGEYAAFVQEMEHKSTGACEVLTKKRGKYDWRSPGFEQDERHPVVCISYADAREYLVWLKGKSGFDYRLPTEAEWEHTARAGTATPYWQGQTVDRKGANVGRSRDGTTVGGMFQMSAWGLSDHTGNVWEMTAECMLEPVKPGEPVRIVEQGERPDCRRLVKGGAWSGSIATARHAARRALKEGGATSDIGLRVVRDVDERDAARILSREDRIALEKAEREAIEIKVREQESVEAARRRALIEAAEEAEMAAAKTKAERDRLAKEKAERQKTEREKFVKDQAEREKAEAVAKVKK